MRKVIASCALAATLIGACSGAAYACGGHHRRYQQPVSGCSSTTCTVNGVCDGTCNGTGSCQWYDGCNYVAPQPTYYHHGGYCH